MTATIEPAAVTGAAKGKLGALRAARARPAAAGVARASFWEIAVRMGLSNGRLVPPPSVIFNTFADLAVTGELQNHALATHMARRRGICFGVAQELFSARLPAIPR